MAKVSNVFINGRMDSDTHYSLQDNKGYVRSENLRISGKGNDGAFQFIKGSEKVSDEYTEKGMLVLGAYEGSNNKNYFLLAMPNGKSKIIEYDIFTKITRLIIEDNSVLRFDLVRWDKGDIIKPYRFILSINQIGDLLFISNEVWEYPRVINIKRDYSVGFLEEDVILAKKPPMFAPEFIPEQFISSSEKQENPNRDTFVSFSYRYKYLDGDYSALSFYSDVAFEPNGFFKINAKRENKAMTNKYKKIKVVVNSGNKNVTDIEVYAREHGSNTAYLIYSVNKKQAGITDNSNIFDIEYQFSKNYEVLSEEVTNMLFSNVPKYPKTQTAVGNRIIYGNYFEGYDLNEVVDFEVRKKEYSLNNTSKRQTAISLFTYKVGVVYFNDYNESTTVLLPTNQVKSEIEIPFENRLKSNGLEVKLLTPPPAFATKMKFVVKSEALNYDILQIGYAKKVGNKIYLQIIGDNINRIHKGDVFIRIDSGSNNYREYEVEDIGIFGINEGLTRKDTYAIIKDDEGEIKIISNGGSIYRSYAQDGTIDTVTGSIDPNRFVGISNRRGVFGRLGYDSVNNQVLLHTLDYGRIKEGDEMNISVTFSYVEYRRKSSGGWRETKRGAVGVVENNIYSEADYDDIGDFLKANMTNPFLDAVKDGGLVCLRTNYNYIDKIKTEIPHIYTSTPDYGNKGRRLGVEVRATIDFKRGIKPITFRTKNKENKESLYYETPKTYLIQNEKIIADSYDIDGNPIFDIGFYNGYCWGNGVESYKIKDKFNAKELKYKFRGNAYEKNGYKRTHRKNDLTYSGMYNYELGINNLSIFNPSLANWKTLPIHYGEIQRIISTDGDITVFCNDKIIQQFYGKSILMDLTGNENVGLSKEVLGDYRVLPYEFGISENPESVAKYSDVLFFSDKNRGRFLMKQGNNIEELNAFGSGFYNEGINLLKDHHTFLGSFDEANNEYVISIDQNFCVGFNINSKGFSSYYSYKSDYLLGSYGRHYSCYNGIIYQNEETSDYNNFAGQGNKEAKLKFVVAPEMGIDKVFKAISLQSNTSWNIEVSTNLTHTKFSESAFTQKESFYYSEIYRDNITTQNIKGVGVVSQIVGNTISFINPIEPDVSVGDILTSDQLISISEIKNIQGNRIVLENTGNIKIGDYMVAQKPMVDGYRPEGVPMRGKWAEITLTKFGNEPYYITSVNTEVIQSKL